MKFLKFCLALNILFALLWIALLFKHPEAEPVRKDSFDGVYGTLEAITYVDITGKRYLRYDLEETALFFCACENSIEGAIVIPVENLE